MFGKKKIKELKKRNAALIEDTNKMEKTIADCERIIKRQSEMEADRDLHMQLNRDEFSDMDLEKKLVTVEQWINEAKFNYHSYDTQFIHDASIIFNRSELLFKVNYWKETFNKCIIAVARDKFLKTLTTKTTKEVNKLFDELEENFKNGTYKYMGIDITSMFPEINLLSPNAIAIRDAYMAKYSEEMVKEHKERWTAELERQLRRRRGDALHNIIHGLHTVGYGHMVGKRAKAELEKGHK